MRRVANLFDRIWEPENIRLAFYKASRGKSSQTMVRHFACQLDERVERISQAIRNDTFPLGRFHQFLIRDPKQRVITAPCFDERVLHHAIMNICEPILDSLLVYDTFACRVGKGRESAVQRARCFAAKHTWYLKFDVRKYFDNVRHDTLVSLLDKRFEDQKLFSHGSKLSLRKIVIELDEPTSDGDTVIELLTNLPVDVSGSVIADSYRSRWSIEGVFGELTLSLNGEINTLAYPPAAIIAYALALISFNVLTLVRASVEVVHGKETADSMSTYHMAEEVSSTDQGMMIAIPLTSWQRKFGSLRPPEMADELKRMAREVEIRRYRKSARGPKKPKAKRTGSFQHVSTQKLLAQQKR